MLSASQGAWLQPELGDSRYQVDSWVVSGTMFCVMTIYPSYERRKHEDNGQTTASEWAKVRKWVWDK